MEQNDRQFRKPTPEKWVELYSTLLYKHALPRVGDSFIAEDLVQETFLAGLKGLDGFKGESSEKNWLFSILKNKIVDYYRKKTKTQEVFSMPDLGILHNEWFNTDGTWATERIPHDWDSSDNPAERKEIQKVIYWCKDHLKAIQQSVFVLKYLEDMKSDEICKVLNISTTNYWTIVHRARLQMRECVEKMLLKN